MSGDRFGAGKPRPAAWHLPAEALRRYAEPGGALLSSSEAASVEAHLDRCAACRGRLLPPADISADISADIELLRGLGAALVDRVGHVPQYRRPRRWRIRLTAGLPTAWLVAVLAVAAVAGALDLVSEAPEGSRPSLLLLLAPVLPLAAVAAAWAPQLDPLHELGASTAAAGLPLLLRRTLVAVSAVVLFSAGLDVVGVAAPPARWLLPCLALTAVTLALGSVVRLHLAAAGLTAAWSLAVVVPALTRQHLPALLDTSAAPAWVAALVLAVAVVALRHRTYRRLPL